MNSELRSKSICTACTNAEKSHRGDLTVLMFYYQLIMLTVICIIAALLAFGPYPLELRISGVVAMSELVKAFKMNLTGNL